MSVSFKISKDELKFIEVTVRRALAINHELDALTLSMDIVACHCNGCPLDLERLSNFDDFNLMHDVYGITDNISRNTGKMVGNFLPRSSK